jgi:hypothetical protein
MHQLQPHPPGHPALRFADNWLRSWRERRYAAERCKSLRDLHTSLRSTQPHLTGEALYLALLSTATGGDAAAARDLLESARESYAEWPVARSLRLRDIVHRLIVLEFSSRHPDKPWLQISLKRVVDSGIPSQL